MKQLRAALAILLPWCCSTVPAADRFEDIRQSINKELIERSVPSITVAVAQNGKIVWEEGFGWADREQRIPATPHTMYSIASISKPLTATGVMLLSQTGQVNLDAPANDYIGNAKLRARVGDANEATVRRIANHTSGLPGYGQFYYADEPFSAPSMDETILRYGNLVSMPGEKVYYSNLGFGVLDYIIERVSGKSFGDFMLREVFLPLGMTRTSLGIGPGLEAFAATRYGADGKPLPFYYTDHPVASEIYSSAHDLVRFGMFHLKTHLADQRAILSDASIDEMHRVTAVGANDGVGVSYSYGVGFEVDDRNGYRVFSHSGLMAGVSAQLKLIPEAKLAVVALNNGGSTLTYDLPDLIAKKFLPKWQVIDMRKRPREPFVTPPELLGVWKGVLESYSGTTPLELNFLPDGNVQAKLGRQLVTLVSTASFNNGEFSGTFAGRVGTPDTDRHGVVYADRISLSLKLRGNVLNGAGNVHDDFWHVPRLRNFLPHWVDLKKAAQR